MTHPPDEYGDLLRRALRTEADAVVPSPDGLEIIRARIERRNVRGLFWWRAGAAAVSAVLVAGAIVMAVPGLRSQIIEVPAQEAGHETSSKVPSNSSTTRSHQPPPAATPDPEQNLVVVPEESRSPTPRPAKTANSTSRPSRTPSPTPTPCPSTAAEQAEQAEAAGECPEASPTPTPTDEEASTQPSACPLEECPPGDATDGPMTVSPLVESSPSTS
jgi:hypothetical protein